MLATKPLGIVLATLITFSLAADAGAVTLRDKWALLVGVDTFQDPSVPVNTSAAKNVADLASILKDPNAGRFAPDHVVVLTGSKATKSGIEQSIGNWLLKKALPDDLILLYVSSASIQGPKGEPMLFSYDTLGSEPELSGLDMHQLAVDLKRRIQSRNIVMLIDATPAGKTGPDFANLSDLGISVITATSGNQKSITNGVSNTSLFEQHLAEALKHNVGGFTLQQIYDHVTQTVAQDAETCFKAKQTPVLALATNHPTAGDVAIGAPVRNSPKAPVTIGHPVDQLALTRPDLLAKTPSSAGTAKPVVAKPVAAKPAADDDDEDDDKPHKEVDFGAYMSKMKSDIQKNWKPPKGLESRRLVAVFSIARDGRILNPTIVEGSGVEAIDKSAMDALHAASPLDPLPPGSPRTVDIKYKFDWNVRRE